MIRACFFWKRNLGKLAELDAWNATNETWASR
jgi:hypothetical protein